MKKIGKILLRILKAIFIHKKSCCKILFLIVLLQCENQKSFAQTDTSSISKANIRKIPSVDIKDLHGKAVNTSTFSNNGKPMIIVFWYSVHKFPTRELDAIQENYEEWKKESGVKVIVISIDDSRTATNVLPMVNTRGWDFEFYIDINSDFKRAMSVNLVPHTFLINGSGEIVWNTVGFMDGNESLIYDELKKIKN